MLYPLWGGGEPSSPPPNSLHLLCSVKAHISPFALHIYLCIEITICIMLQSLLSVCLYSIIFLSLLNLFVLSSASTPLPLPLYGINSLSISLYVVISLHPSIFFLSLPPPLFLSIYAVIILNLFISMRCNPSLSFLHLHPLYLCCNSSISLYFYVL